MIELLDTHLDLALAAETGSARFRTGAYAFWRAHVQVLLRAAGVADPHGTLAETLLAPLAGEFYRHLRNSGATKAQILATLRQLAHATCHAQAP